VGEQGWPRHREPKLGYRQAECIRQTYEIIRAIAGAVSLPRTQVATLGRGERRGGYR
jgi:hypothetical protein